MILTPLVVMSVLLGYWRFTAAQDTAEDLFDRSLLSAALAISRDVAVSGGDALSPTTRDLIRGAAGGEVFYHATGPDGIYVTGYAYPPVTGLRDRQVLNTPKFDIGQYRGEPVRVLRISERTSIDNLSGISTITVWQRLSDRNAFARTLAIRATSVMAALLTTLAGVIWFGVKFGLAPLTDLQQAIAARTPEDLNEIRRPVPVEVQGIVDTLNRLFRQVRKSIDAQRSFVSDAAHQLRNPAAAVQSMAESVRDARDPAERDRRIAELIDAARASARVANQLLSLDRLRTGDLSPRREQFDLNGLVAEVCEEMGPQILSRGLTFSYGAADDKLIVTGDRIFLAEVIKNLLDNSLKHGGAALTAISVETSRAGNAATVRVRDDGKGLSPKESEQAFGRFSQVEPSQGSGLGLAIAASAAERHGGNLVIEAVERGACLALTLPLEDAD